MKYLIAIAVLTPIIGLAYAAYKAISQKKNKPSTMIVMCGEVIDIVRDEETGLSCIVMDDEKGNTVYGISNIPVQDLEIMYVGKGIVQIPVVSTKTIVNPSGTATEIK